MENSETPFTDTLLTRNDWALIAETYGSVQEQRDRGNKCTLTKKLSCGTATIYHMGEKNPTIRIDIKENQREQRQTETTTIRSSYAE